MNLVARRVQLLRLDLSRSHWGPIDDYMSHFTWNGVQGILRGCGRYDMYTLGYHTFTRGQQKLVASLTLSVMEASI